MYSEVLVKKGVPEKHHHFYLNWAHKFALWLKGVPLRERSLDDIRAFVAELRESEVPAWQVGQAREAIAILSRDHLNIELKALPAIRQESDGIRDRVRSIKSLEKQYEAVFSNIRKVIALHHYSPRTAEAYTSWARRYFVFCELEPAEQIPGKQIGVYLSYLAEVKHTSASTQNQALNALVFLYTKVLGRDPKSP